MSRTVKHNSFQMSLLDEDEWESVPKLDGADVFCEGQGRVGRQWRSMCREERALTRGLMEQVCSPSNLVTALRQVVRNKGGAGVDGMSVKDLQVWFQSNWQRLSESLQTGTYQVTAVRTVIIPKPSGGERKLGIPTVRDRLVQQAISQVLIPRYEQIFSEHSYGFRPRRSAHGALREATTVVSTGKDYVVDMDLEKFFDEVNHDRLLWLLGTRIGDRRILTLIGKFLRAGMLTGGMNEQRTKGTPQGSPLSPLLSNIVLDELDKELERRGHSFVRYADDLIIMVGSEQAAKRVQTSITGYIEGRLRLKVNREKSRICRPYQLNFLGHSILSKGRLGLSRQSERRFKKKLKELTGRNRGISLEQLVKELNPVLRGWLNYFGLAQMNRRLSNLESWLNRRIRCFRLKQCKRAIGISRFLRRLGVPNNRSWTTAGSSKGWHRLAGTHAAHEGMSLKWFRSIGLFSLNAHYRLDT